MLQSHKQQWQGHNVNTWIESKVRKDTKRLGGKERVTTPVGTQKRSHLREICICIHLKGKNTNNQKTQLKTVRTPEGGIPIPRNSRAQQRRRLFSPARTQPMKSHELFISPSPPNFLFPSIKVLPIIKVFSLPRYAGTCLWLTMFADYNAILCRSWINPSLLKKLISGLQR